MSRSIDKRICIQSECSVRNELVKENSQWRESNKIYDEKNRELKAQLEQKDKEINDLKDKVMCQRFTLDLNFEEIAKLKSKTEKSNISYTAIHEGRIEKLQARNTELEKVVDAAIGLTHGEDWNNGTHAKIYRPKLKEALNNLKEPRE